MLAFLSSIFSGGLTGLLGVAFQRFFDFLKVKQEIQMKKMDQDHELSLRRQDAEIMREEWAARTKVAAVEAAGREAAADAEAFGKSFAMEPARYSEGVTLSPAGGMMLVVVDLLRGIVRPGITLYLCVITTIVYLDARAILAAYKLTLPVNEAVDLVKLIVSTILYLTTTCVLWWFGTRNKQKPPGVK